MKIGIIAITRGGRELARTISEKLDNTTLLEKQKDKKSLTSSLSIGKITMVLSASWRLVLWSGPSPPCSTIN